VARAARFPDWALHARARREGNRKSGPHAPPTPPFFARLRNNAVRDVCDVRIFRQREKLVMPTVPLMIAADLRKGAS
jgi:hypothetical protein